MDEIAAYHKGFPKAQRQILDLLREELDGMLGRENSKLWHGAPVWFVENNPVAGYSINSRGVCLLFWNGRNFLDVDLIPVGKFFAAEKRYQTLDDIVLPELRNLIKQAQFRIWDSVSFQKEQRAKRQSK